MTNDRGKFITLEGIDGVGKTEQTSRIVNFLNSSGIPTIKTREPGGTPGAEKIRELILNPKNPWYKTTDTVLHFAARVEHYHTCIKPSLQRHCWVVSDRFIDSTRAYQGWGLGQNQELIEQINRVCFGNFAPDLTLILDLPVETALARCKQADRYEQMDLDFYRRVQYGYLSIAETHSDRCVVIDASGTIEQVFDLIQEKLELCNPQGWLST